jgi:hypothetical protein
MQPDDHLNAVASTYHTVGTKGFEDVVTLRFRHIDQRDTQPGGAVVDALNIARPAQSL